MKNLRSSQLVFHWIFLLNFSKAQVLIICEYRENLQISYLVTRNSFFFNYIQVLLSSYSVSKSVYPIKLLKWKNISKSHHLDAISRYKIYIYITFFGKNSEYIYSIKSFNNNAGPCNEKGDTELRKCCIKLEINKCYNCMFSCDTLN